MEASRLISELRHRRVIRALVGYGVATFAVLQIVEPVMHGLHWPEQTLSYVVVALAAGFPIVIALAWIFDVNEGRIERAASTSGLRRTTIAARGMESGGLSSFGGVVILVVWLCGPLVLAEGRSGHIIMLLGGILGLGVLVLHMRGAGLVSSRIANSGRVFFWVWTLIALGVTSTVSGILSARGLWSLRRGQSR